VRRAMTEAGRPGDSAAEGYETEDAYLARIDQPGAEVTDSTLKSFSEARYKANRDAMSGAADALLDAGLPAEKIEALARGYATASKRTRGKVDALLVKEYRDTRGPRVRALGDDARPQDIQEALLALPPPILALVLARPHEAPVGREAVG
jgi:hypothetical protein